MGDRERERERDGMGMGEREREIKRTKMLFHMSSNTPDLWLKMSHGALLLTLPICQGRQSFWQASEHC